MKNSHPFLVITFALLGLLLACEEDFLDDIPYTPPTTIQNNTIGGIIIPKQDSTSVVKDSIPTTAITDSIPNAPTTAITDSIPNAPIDSIAPTPATPTHLYPGYDKILLTNRELIQALIREGYTFVGDSLVKNEKFATTTVLNLSHAGLRNINNIEIFTLLEKVNLSHNNFESISFNFGQLPPKVQEIDLQENQLYEFENLAYTNYNTGEFSLKRRFDKIIFPASARFNVEHTLAYYSTCNGCDMQIPNPHKNNALEPLTNLRYVPCMELFSSDYDYRKMIWQHKDEYSEKGNINIFLYHDYRPILVKDQQSIDLYKIPQIIERTLEPFHRYRFYTHLYEFRTEEMLCHNESLEFLAYIINSPMSRISRIEQNIYNPLWRKYREIEGIFEMPYIKVFQHMKEFHSHRLKIKHLNLSQATGLEKLHLFNIPTLNKLNLSHTEIFKNGVADLVILNCSNLEEIILPKRTITRIDRLMLWGNPLSKHLHLDLEKVNYIYSGNLQLSGNLSLVFPERIDQDDFRIMMTPTREVSNGHIYCSISSELAEKYTREIRKFTDNHTLVDLGIHPSNTRFWYSPFVFNRHNGW